MKHDLLKSQRGVMCSEQLWDSCFRDLNFAKLRLVKSSECDRSAASVKKRTKAAVDKEVSASKAPANSGIEPEAIVSKAVRSAAKRVVGSHTTNSNAAPIESSSKPISRKATKSKQKQDKDPYHDALLAVMRMLHVSNGAASGLAAHAEFRWKLHISILLRSQLKDDYPTEWKSCKEHNLGLSRFFMHLAFIRANIQQPSFWRGDHLRNVIFIYFFA